MKANHAHAEPTKQVGIWIRVSTEEQAQGDSPKHHEARARHYAAAKGWNVHGVYDLAGVSGKAVMEHPETKRMMEDVRQGRISGLIFSKLARLTRNARELMDFSDFFREHNADLVSLQENIDTGTPSGRLSSEQIMAEARDLDSRWPKMNHDERRRIVELLVKNVVIGNGDITLNLCYLPSFEVMTNKQRIV